MSKQVRITLGKDGSIKAEAEGFTGSGCEEATEFLAGLFDDPDATEYKSEYYEEMEVVVGGLPSGYCG